MSVPESIDGAPPVRRRLQVIGRIVLLLVVLCGGLLVASNLWVIVRGAGCLEHDFNQLPVNKVGLVLGTSPTIGTRVNQFFEGRMDTAARLYKAGKVQHLLLSGDNRRRNYDEPAAMRAALIARGVPGKALVIDAAGFRTLDSIARARAVFGLKKITIVTDNFHQARALFLARVYGIDAVGFASKPISWRRSVKTRVREWGSRLKACLDVYLLGTKPRFYGPRILIEEEKMPL
ncbi:MAG: putative rane protein [Chthoniobacteraceae bacterium]|nr:putative rane protein [Chthoniobacteraceae bacterium]